MQFAGQRLAFTSSKFSHFDVISFPSIRWETGVTSFPCVSWKMSNSTSTTSSASVAVIPRMAGANYTIYTSKPPISSTGDFSFPDGTSGYVICELNSKITITTIGSAKKPVDVFGKRRFSCRVAQSGSCLLNGASHSSVYVPNATGYSYVPDPECFITIDGTQVVVDMATNGFYCIDNQFLFCVKEVKLNQSIKMKVDGSGNRSFTLPTGWKSIYHAGEEEIIGAKDGTNMLTSGNANDILISSDANVKELFYIEMADGSFTNVEIGELVIGKVALPASMSGYYDILQGYRCQLLQPFDTTNPSVISPALCAARDGTIESFTLDATRFTNQTVRVKVDVYWMSQVQADVYNLFFEVKHPSQETFIDLSANPSVKSVESTEKLLMVSNWHTKLNCTFNDDSKGEIHIWRQILPYTVVQGKAVRFEVGKALPDENSTGVYMVDGVVYSESTLQSKFSADFNSNVLSLRPKKGVQSYATYDGNGTWTMHQLRAKITFDEKYTYFTTTVSAGKIEVPMKAFGDWDPQDTFTFTADGASLSKNVYKLKPDQATPSETVISTVKFIATDSERNTYPFTVDFVFKNFSRISFIISDSENFSSPYFKRSSFNGSNSFAPFWTYGSFIGQPNVAMNAYGNQVVNGSLDSNIYPVISFNDGSAGTITKTNGSLEIKAQLLREDLVIPMVPSDEYVRLNACSDVEYTGSALKVPMNASVSFFRIGNVIYLLRTPLTKSISFGSFNGTQNTDPAAVPSAVASTEPVAVEVKKTVPQPVAILPKVSQAIQPVAPKVQPSLPRASTTLGAVARQVPAVAGAVTRVQPKAPQQAGNAKALQPIQTAQPKAPVAAAVQPKAPQQAGGAKAPQTIQPVASKMPQQAVAPRGSVQAKSVQPVPQPVAGAVTRVVRQVVQPAQPVMGQRVVTARPHVPARSTRLHA